MNETVAEAIAGTHPISSNQILVTTVGVSPPDAAPPDVSKKPLCRAYGQ